MTAEIVELTIEPVQEVFVSSSTTVDMLWRFVDAAGHEHRWANGYPTLDLVIDRSEWCDGQESHDPHELVIASHYECRECRQRIRPGEVPPGRPQVRLSHWSGQVVAIRDNVEIRTTLSAGEADTIRALHPDRDAMLAAAAEIVDGWDPFDMGGRPVQYEWVS